MTNESSWDAIGLINESAWPGPVKNLVRAMLQWRDGKTGELYPSIRTIAKALGVAESTARQYIASAIEHGALVFVGNRSGGRRPTRYRLLLPETSPTNPPTIGGFVPKTNPPDFGGQGTGIRHRTRRNQAPNPPDTGPDPSMIQPKNHPPQPAAVDVFTRFGIEHLRGHANATPERLAWIEREAPSKRNPSSWAAECIRKGYRVPSPTEADEVARCKAERDANLSRFDAMPPDKRAALIAQAREAYPNLDDAMSHPDDSPAVRGAVANLLAESCESAPAPSPGARPEAVAESMGDGCHTATCRVHSGHGSTDEGHRGGGEDERSNALRDRQGRGGGPESTVAVAER